ncbi:hypothetical protein BGX29_001658, partial [Mortierella sp. GBA35]
LYRSDSGGISFGDLIKWLKIVSLASNSDNKLRKLEFSLLDTPEEELNDLGLQRLIDADELEDDNNLPMCISLRSTEGDMSYFKLPRIQTESFVE